MAARFWVFLSRPLLTSRFANAQPHHHHHLVHATTPPLHTIPCCHFTCLNQATTARFLVLAQTPSLPPILRAHSPATTTPTSYALPHHPYAPSPVAIPHGPKPSQNSLVSDFGPNPLPASHFVSAQPHHHRHLINTTPPLRIIPLHCFTRRTWNPATTARFHLFGPNPVSCLMFTNTTPHHHLLLICTIAPCPLTIIHPHFRWRAWNRALVAWFWILGPQPPLPPHICEPNAPSPPPPHQHLPLLLSTSIPDGPPEIEPQWLGFGFLALN